MNEERLSLLRNLVLLLVALVLVLGGIVVNQMQQTSDLRKSVEQISQNVLLIQSGMDNAQKQLMPDLNKRFENVESKMKEMPAQIQSAEAEAEKHFIKSMQTQLPTILDKYIEEKKKEIIRSAGGSTPR